MDKVIQNQDRRLPARARSVKAAASDHRINYCRGCLAGMQIDLSLWNKFFCLGISGTPFFNCSSLSIPGQTGYFPLWYRQKDIGLECDTEYLVQDFRPGSYGYRYHLTGSGLLLRHRAAAAGWMMVDLPLPVAPMINRRLSPRFRGKADIGLNYLSVQDREN